MPATKSEAPVFVEEQQTDWLALTAGPLGMRFEPRTAFLRHIRLGEVEVLRGVYPAVRDQYWGTIEPNVRIQSLDREEDSFFVLYEADASQGDIRFHWKGTIRGSADGVIRFGFDGRARSTFSSNRIGFCVLHPAAECAGRPCRIEHVDGSIENGVFPSEIAPHQPFIDVRAIGHEVTEGVSAEVRMQGDAFEMEDQRNWTDASFKTYSRPLRLPRPVEFAAGTVVQQAITLTLKRATPGAITRALSPRARNTITGAAPVAVRPSDRDVTIRIAGDPRTAVPLPPLGFEIGEVTKPGRTNEGAGAPSGEDLALLRALGPAHVRLNVDLGSTEWSAHLKEASKIAESLECAIELAAYVETTEPADRQLKALRSALMEAEANLARVFVLEPGAAVTSADVLRTARRSLADLVHPAPVGGGTGRYFTQLNQNRPSPELLDVVCYSMNPQVHAFDNLSMVETLPVQGDTVRNVREFLPETGVAPGPITLRPRDVRGATPGSSRAPADPRQKELFAACWTLGSIRYLAAAGVDSLTYYELTGSGGVMPGGSGKVYPLYHVFADLAEFSGANVLRTDSTRPLAVDALALQSGHSLRLLLANMSSEHQTARVRLPDPVARQRLRLRALDETVLKRAARPSEGWRTDGIRPYESPPDAASADLLRELTVPLAPNAYVCIDA